MGAHFNQYPKRIFVGSTQVEDGTRILGLTIRGQKRVSGGNVGPTGFICVCGPGLVGKTLLHRVGISRAPLIVSGCHFGE